MESKKLGFGLMRLPLTEKDNQESIDMEQLNKMVDTFIERGFTYFDTAYMYHNFKSEIALREYFYCYNKNANNVFKKGRRFRKNF